MSIFLALLFVFLASIAAAPFDLTSDQTPPDSQSLVQTDNGLRKLHWSAPVIPLILSGEKSLLTEKTTDDASNSGDISVRKLHWKKIVKKIKKIIHDVTPLIPLIPTREKSFEIEESTDADFKKLHWTKIIKKINHAIHVLAPLIPLIPTGDSESIEATSTTTVDSNAAIIEQKFEDIAEDIQDLEELLPEIDDSTEVNDQTFKLRWKKIKKIAKKIKQIVDDIDDIIIASGYSGVSTNAEIDNFKTVIDNVNEAVENITNEIVEAEQASVDDVTSSESDTMRLHWKKIKHIVHDLTPLIPTGEKSVSAEELNEHVNDFSDVRVKKFHWKKIVKKIKHIIHDVTPLIPLIPTGEKSLERDKSSDVDVKKLHWRKIVKKIKHVIHDLAPLIPLIPTGASVSINETTNVDSNAAIIEQKIEDIAQNLQDLEELLPEIDDSTKVNDQACELSWKKIKKIIKKIKHIVDDIDDIMNDAAVYPDVSTNADIQNIKVVIDNVNQSVENITNEFSEAEKAGVAEDAYSTKNHRFYIVQLRNPKQKKLRGLKI